MQDFLVSIFYFLKPVLSIDAGLSILSVDLFDVLTLLLIGGFFLIWLAGLIAGTTLKITMLDFSIFLFAFWVFSLLVIYPKASNIGEAAKFTIPMLGFVFFKSFLHSR